MFSNRLLTFASLVVLVSSTVCAAGPTPADATVLTLEQALTIAQSANPTVLIGREAALQAAATARLQQSNLWPQITWDNTQRRSRSASVGGALVRSGINNRFDSAVNGRLDLLDPQRLASYKAAKVAATAAEQNSLGIAEAAIATVAEVYFDHLRNLSRIEVLDSNTGRARALLELARRQAEAGVATQIDVTRAEALLVVAEQARLQQETVVQQSEFLLKQLLALNMAAPLRLDTFQFARKEAPIFSAEQEQAALAHRPDLLAAETILRQNELEVRAARFDRLPSLALNASTGAASENVLDGNDTKVWSGTVSLSVPVFDGQRIRSQTSLAQSRLRQQQIRVDDLRRRIGAEVRLAVQDANSSLAQIAVAEKNQRLSEDELRLARLRYEQGVADNREIVDAQNRLAQSSDNLVAALHQYNLSRVELARVKGNVRSLLTERAP
ncbi:MAG: TolC family protein [Opitutaceae bacterium]|nr:TolC family protein [Opitutaceae bacterium]